MKNASSKNIFISIISWAFENDSQTELTFVCAIAFKGAVYIQKRESREFSILWEEGSRNFELILGQASVLEILTVITRKIWLKSQQPL